MEVTDLMAFYSGLPCTFLPLPSANARLPGSPFNQQTSPTVRDRKENGKKKRKEHGGCTEVMVKLEVLPTAGI